MAFSPVKPALFWTRAVVTWAPRSIGRTRLGPAMRAGHIGRPWEIRAGIPVAPIGRFRAEIDHAWSGGDAALPAPSPDAVG
ncbi:MAG: hypothetical protein GY859_34775 [Desulfobacterales bacterium]|nr:hypothetical protein [Desulfobacterales bacterium]